MGVSAERLLVIGATSAIAHSVARRWAARGARLLLLGRNLQVLEANAADLRVRGATNVQFAPFDALNVSGHAQMLDQAFAAFGGFDAALVAWGHLPDQAECEASVEAALQAFDVNGRSVVALLTEIAPRFEAQHSGVIGVISSPAGDRGRASNYVYGAAKAAVTVMASGLRHRLARSGVRVVTLLPGYVDTPMTAAFVKGLFWTSPERVARSVDAALKSGFGSVYTPWYWCWIMRVIRVLPERLFVRTRL